MKVKLNESRVKAFACPPDKSQAFLWDETVPGLGLRALPDYVDRDGTRRPGAKSWVFQGRVRGAGVERRVRLGTYPIMPLLSGDPQIEGALQAARRVRYLLDQGVDPVAKAQEDAQAKAQAQARAKARALTLRELAEDYIAHKRTRNGPLKPNTVRDIRKHVGKAFAAWANKPVVELTAEQCVQRHRDLARGGLTGERPAPAQAAQAFTVLRALLAWAQRKWIEGAPLLAHNPAEAVRAEMAPPKVRGILIAPEHVGATLRALRGVATDPALLPATRCAADALLFMLYTGARADECLSLEWARVEVGEDAGSWHLPAPKGGKPTTFPLNAQARAVLARRLAERRGACPWVFPGRDRRKHLGTPRGPEMQAAIEASKVPALNRHALRATFTNIGDQVLRLDLQRLELLTGHTAKGVTRRVYTNAQDLRWLAPEAHAIGRWMQQAEDMATASNVHPLPKRA